MLNLSGKKLSKEDQRKILKDKCKELTKLKILQNQKLRTNPLTLEILERYCEKRDENTSKVGNSSKKNDENSLKGEKLVIDLYNFIHGTDLDKKLRFLFRFYDTDNDGYIGREDLYKILAVITDNKLEGNKIEEIIQSTYNGNRVENIDFDKFKEMLEFKGALRKCFDASRS